MPATTSLTSPLSLTTSTCVPQCMKHVEEHGLQASQFEATCYCDPACGGNAHPKLGANNSCPNQVAVVS